MQYIGNVYHRYILRDRFYSIKRTTYTIKLGLYKYNY